MHTLRRCNVADAMHAAHCHLLALWDGRKEERLALRMEEHGMAVCAGGADAEGSGCSPDDA